MKGLFGPQRGHNHRLRTAVLVFLFVCLFSPFLYPRILVVPQVSLKSRILGCLSAMISEWMDVFPSIGKLFKDFGSCWSDNLMDVKRNPGSYLRKELQTSVEKAQKP